jgi:hypothetical protein
MPATRPASGACGQRLCAITVSGSHTYAEETTTPWTVTVTVYTTSDTVLVSAQGPANVADAPWTGSGVNLTVAAGQPLTPIPGDVAIASFSDANPAGGAADITHATINWGDGSPISQGLVVNSGPGTVQIQGNHVYMQGGRTYTITTTITDDGGQTATATSSTATVSVAEGSPYTFTIQVIGPGASTAKQDKATVFWGDGSYSAATVQDISGNLVDVQVTATHVYAEEGVYPIYVIVSDSAGDTSTATSSIAIADAPLEGQDSSFTGEAGVSQNGETGETFVQNKDQEPVYA